MACRTGGEFSPTGMGAYGLEAWLFTGYAIGFALLCDWLFFSFTNRYVLCGS
jgi:hypothetical protein